MPLLLLTALLIAGVPVGEAGTGYSTTLQQVSFSERADGGASVVRLHFDRPIAAFSDPASPEAGLLELTVYNVEAGREATSGQAAPPVRAYDVQQRERNVVITFALDSPDVEIHVERDRNTDDLLLFMTRRAPLPIVLGPEEPTTISAVPVRAAPATAARWRVDTIVIDAGHGGKDTGAVGYGGLREKDVVLSVALKVGRYLEEHLGVRVIYTRDDDRFIELHERGSIANRADGKLFVSIHANAAASSQAHGTETFFLGMHRTESAQKVMERENSVIELEEDLTHYEKYDQAGMVRMQLAQGAFMRKSESLASRVQSEFAERVDRRNRGVKQAGFVVLYEAAMPSILVELGFVTNPAEAQFLRSDRGQDYLASAIFRAIRHYRDTVEAELGVTTAVARDDD